MDSGQILIVDLSKGKLGEQNAHVLGALLVSALSQAAFAREDTPQHLRRPFYLYADEFQDYASAGFMRILSQAQKLRVRPARSRTSTSPRLSDGLRDAVLGNTRRFIASGSVPRMRRRSPRTSGLTAELDYTRHGHARDATGNLYSHACRTSRPTAACSSTTRRPTRCTWKCCRTRRRSKPAADRIATFSRMRYGTDRRVVEDKIGRFLAGP